MDSVSAEVLMHPCQGDVVFIGESKSTLLHLGIIKIAYNRTAMHFMDDSFMNLGKEVILTLP